MTGRTHPLWLAWAAAAAPAAAVAVPHAAARDDWVPKALSAVHELMVVEALAAEELKISDAAISEAEKR